MKKRKFFAILLSLCLLIAAAVPAQAAVTDFSIYFDGVAVDYSKIDDGTGIFTLPQILNSRAMVPVRQTTHYLGIQMNWNPDTRTMTMTKGNSVATHVLASSVVTINGVDKVFDTPSMVVDDKTLMPNIMIAEIVNCDTWWENETRSVIMRTRQEPVVVQKPEIVSVTASKQEVMLGEEWIVIAMGNNLTSRVSLYNHNGVEVASSAEYVQTGDYRSFTLRYAPTTITFSALQYKVVAGDAAGFNNDGYKTALLEVAEGITITSVTADKNQPYNGETVRFTVTASDQVTRVRLTDTATNKTYDSTNYVNSGSVTVFTVDVPITEGGDKLFSVEIGTAAFLTKTDKTVTINARGEKPKDPIAIQEVVVDNTVAHTVNQDVTVTVRTSLSCAKVEIYDAQTRTYETFTTYTDSATYRTFTTRARMSTNGTNSFTAIAYDEAGAKAERAFTISPYGTTSRNGMIQNVTNAASTNANGMVTLTIYTTTYVQTVVVTDSMGYTYYPVFTPGTDPNQYTWTVDVNISNNIFANYIIKATDYSNNPDTVYYNLQSGIAAY
ncbi:MAG: copper amine oxidase N-terminal domain-containing protein [Clostridiales bacterium]|jgi:hypothetical protein|nr:copper amine oxidase N-terminal domain-containing protein [Clostridiales bacterium]